MDVQRTLQQRDLVLLSDEIFDSIDFALPKWFESPEDERLAAAEQAKKDAIEAARQKRLAAERKKKQAEDDEDDARSAKLKAEQDARDAQERARIRSMCAGVYERTSDKKVSDLTVKESQQIQACQVLGLYPPR